jgi:hypothetical protein
LRQERAFSPISLRGMAGIAVGFRRHPAGYVRDAPLS